jgi:hypothetical protein
MQRSCLFHGRLRSKFDTLSDGIYKVNVKTYYNYNIDFIYAVKYANFKSLKRKNCVPSKSKSTTKTKAPE